MGSLGLFKHSDQFYYFGLRSAQLDIDEPLICVHTSLKFSEEK